MTQDKVQEELIEKAPKLTDAEILLELNTHTSLYEDIIKKSRVISEAQRDADHEYYTSIIQSMKPEVDEPLNDEEKDEGIGTEHSIYSPMGKVPSNPVKQFIDKDISIELQNSHTRAMEFVTWQGSIGNNTYTIEDVAMLAVQLWNRSYGKIRGIQFKI